MSVTPRAPESFCSGMHPSLSRYVRVRVLKRRLRPCRCGRKRDKRGPGLVIVASIAKAHGGTAYVDNVLEDGARFVLGLPSRSAYGGGGPEGTLVLPPGPWPEGTNGRTAEGAASFGPDAESGRGTPGQEDDARTGGI